MLARFDNAIRLDPGFAGAWAGKAAALTALGNTAFSAADAGTYYGEAVEAAEEAVRLGPDLGEAHSWLATILFVARLDARGAREPYERSVQLDGGSSTVQARFAQFAALTGRDEEAQRAVEAAMDLDPLNPMIFKDAGLVHYAAGRYDSAIEHYRHSLELDPDITGSHSRIGSALMLQGDVGAGIEECLLELSVLLREPCLAIGHFRDGNAQAAREAMARLVETYGDAGLYQQAQVQAQWG